MRDDTVDVLGQVSDFARDYLAALDGSPVLPAGAADAEAALTGSLPENGSGAPEALRVLLGAARDGATRSSGPRFFHFVTGGTTPAALAADWLTAAIDQHAYSYVGSRLAAGAEQVSTGWLAELFELPRDWAGVLTTGATTANLVGLAAARAWWAGRHGVDVDDQGLAGLPAMPVLAGGYVHPSARKALAVLGAGRSGVRVLARDGVGRVDLAAMDAALRDLGGAPAVVIANAGEVNAGDFDPVADLADLVERHGAWLHVDGAFGLFARLSPRSRGLTEGVERADSVASDAHKWLNVPYDSGFVFVRDAALMGSAFGLAAAYLPGAEPTPTYGHLAMESSRRARAFAVWATLRAYGRAGYRDMVERHLDLAQRVAARVDAADDLERLAAVPLNIVCFRYRPAGVAEGQLDELNTRLGEAVLADGRVYVGTTTYDGKVAFRPAIVNWRTGEDDVDLLVDVVRALGAGMTGR